MLQDTLELFEYVWKRFLTRMAGLSDHEWQWQPTAEQAISIQWRLNHIAAFLCEERNRPWLGINEVSYMRSLPAEPASAAEAMMAVERAYEYWMILLRSLSQEDVMQPVGE